MLKWVKKKQPKYEFLAEEVKTGAEIATHGCLQHPTYAFKAIVFLSHEAKDLAEQLTILDSMHLKLIKPVEFTTFGWMTKQGHTQCPNLVNYLDGRKALSKWVVDLCLRGTTPYARAGIIGHFIEMSAALKKLNNFHSCSAIVDGLQNAAVQRLDQTWSRVPAEKIIQYRMLKAIFTSKKKYRDALRNVIKNQTPLRCIPDLNAFLISLTRLDYKLRGYGALPNFVYKARLSRKYETMERIQTDSNYDNIREIPPVLNYMISILFFTRELSGCSSTCFYEKSIRMEPPERREVLKAKKNL